MPSLDVFRPLDPGDFSFHGFDDLMTEVERTLREIGIRGGPLTTSVVEDAIFVPSARMAVPDRGEGRFSHEGSLVTSDGRTIDLAQARRRTLRWGPLVRGGLAEQVPVKPERTVDEEVVYLGWYLGHFGHFLSESLTRTWFLEEIDPSVKVVFHKKWYQQPPSGTMRRILEVFGVPLERILFLDAPTRLRRVIVPEPLQELHWSVHERLPRRFRQVAAKIVDGGRPSPQPVYLSRRLLPAKRRQIVGEFEMEEVLRENGFLIAYPETMTFEDQVRLVNQHTDIFTSAGSAAYNVLFSLNRPALHLLTSGIPRQDYFLMPAVAEASASYCNCLGQGGRPAIKSTPLLAETPKFVDYLDSRGFLSKRLRASLVGRGHQMRDSFDEAWFFATVRDVRRSEGLSADDEREALIHARSSWPLSLMLAWYYSTRDSSRVDDLARQFAELASAESDIGRLALYHEAMETAATAILKRGERLTPETVAAVASVLSDRFLIDAVEGQDGRGKKASRTVRPTKSRNGRIED